jgi:hypothetical protein
MAVVDTSLERSFETLHYSGSQYWIPDEIERFRLLDFIGAWHFPSHAARL